MIDSQVIEPSTKQAVGYPVLKRYSNTNMSNSYEVDYILLVIGQSEGIVVSMIKSCYQLDQLGVKVGYYHDAMSESLFDYFEGEVILSNRDQKQ